MEKLKQLRIENGYNFREMAELVGISKPFYWQLENNQRRVTYELAIQIAKVFDLKPDDIFYDELKDRKEFLKKGTNSNKKKESKKK